MPTSTPDTLAARIAALSREKRALLERKLQQPNGLRSTASTISRRATHAPPPLSFAQQRLWFLDQLEPESSVYNIADALRLHGPLDITALEQSVNAIVQRHEALRTTFSMSDGEPVQVIAPSLTAPLAIIDLRRHSESEREAETRRLAREESLTPFVLSHGPLLRVTLLRLTDTEHLLLLTVHHIVADGWSLEVLYRELSLLYQAFHTGQPAPLSELPIQYADYTLWQREWLQGEVLEKQLDYWKTQLHGAPPMLTLPMDRPRPAVYSYRGARETLELSAELTQALKTLSQREGVTLFMMLLAAFQILLSHHTNQEDLVVGAPIAGRTRQEIEGLIGFFVNTLALRADLSGNPSCREILRRVRDVTIGAYAHQELPFEKLVEELQPERSLSYSPVFQVMFALHNTPSTELQLPELTVSFLQVEQKTAKFDLTLSFQEEKAGLRGWLIYNTDLFDQQTITQMLGHYQTVLEGIVSNPEQQLAELWQRTRSEYHHPRREQLFVTQEDRHDQSLRQGKSFSCVIIGDTSLPVQCAEILSRAGHRIQAIISDNPEFRQWARAHQVPAYYLKDDWSVPLAERSFDYLFSIFNLHILPAAILSLPSQLAINFHDAPLPKYAGMHAPTWALLRHETEYGITWHVMTQEIDAGDILKQHRFAIAPDDTSLSLNLKCYEAAIASFQELVDELAEHQFSRTPQDRGQRTYFSQPERPPSGAVISWRSSAEDIAGLCRALSFGPYLNPLTCPKLQLNRDFFIVADYALRKSLTPAPAGTIRALQPDSITVATMTDDFVVKSLLTLGGAPITIDHLAGQYRLQVGQQLTELDPGVLSELTQQECQIAKHEAFWRGRLASAQPVQLPYLSQSVNERHDTVILPVSFSLPATSNTLRAQSWTREHLLLTVFAVYLSRLNSASPFDIGFTSSAQREDAHHLTPLRENFFAAQVPFRVDVNTNGSFAQAYAAIEREVALCVKHQTYTRDLVVRDPELRGLSTTNLAASVSVVFLPLADEEERSSQGGITLYVTPASPTQETSDTSNIAATITYNPNAIDYATLTRMVKHLQTLLAAAVTNPEQRTSTLPLLTDDERQQLLVEWNDTARDFPLDTCVQQLFAAQVARTPSAVAVVHEDQQLTYAELNAQANQLAHYLQKRGVGPGVLVGLCVKRSLAMVIGMLGILKAGGAYVPLDPSYPKERLTLMLEDMQASVLVTHSQLITLNMTTPEAKSDNRPPGAASSPCMRVVALDADSNAISRESVENPTRPVPSESLAYVIYTSGSTGRPKGVEIIHRALTNFVTSAGEMYALQPTDRVLQFASISFDAAVEEIFPCLMRGGTLVLRTESMLESIATFLQRSREWHLSVWDLPTAYWHELTQEIANTRLEVPEHLRLVIIGGEAALPERLAQWQSTVGDRVRLLNTYGPTEATVVATAWDAEHSCHSNHSAKQVPIGRAIANVHTYVLDQQRNPVPIGVPGELYIGGTGLARGYLNQPKLTAEKFITHSFDGKTSHRLYRTGDLVRYLSDGNLEFLGRIDHQVKIRGFRIELGEIEALLVQHNVVREAIVTAREDRSGDKQIVAYVVPCGKGKASARRELRDYLKTKLPTYMVPSALVFLEAFPLTPNGKVDRKALQALEQSSTDRDHAYVAPRTATEETLAHLWSEVLGVQQIGAHDNFFDLGGHSLKAAQLISRVRSNFTVELPLRRLFETPTVAGLATTLDSLMQAETTSVEPTSSLIPLQPAGKRPPFFGVPGHNGDVFCYIALARHLGPEQSFYGLQPPGTDGKRAPLTNVKELAAYFVADIRKFQPEGPYLLAGYCLGGITAFEIAQQLRRAGQEVALLALFGTQSPTALHRSHRAWRRAQWFRQRVHNWVKTLWRLPLRETTHYLFEKIRQRQKAKEERASVVLHYPYRPQVEQATVKATRRYKPERYAGRISLFLPNLNPDQLDGGRFLEWKTLTTDHFDSGFGSSECTGDTMLREPYVKTFAELLRSRLDRFKE